MNKSDYVIRMFVSSKLKPNDLDSICTEIINNNGYLHSSNSGTDVSNYSMNFYPVPSNYDKLDFDTKMLISRKMKLVSVEFYPVETSYTYDGKPIKTVGDMKIYIETMICNSCRDIIKELFGGDVYENSLSN